MIEVLFLISYITVWFLVLVLFKTNKNISLSMTMQDQLVQQLLARIAQLERDNVNDNIASIDDQPDEDLLALAREIIRESRNASISSLQKTLEIGYNKSARIVEHLEKEGLVSEMDRAGVRKVL